MSESQKRPGVRDISDLKARLGLKKTGSSAPAAGAAPSTSPSPVVPPPGLALPSNVPAPPGTAGYQPPTQPGAAASPPPAQAPSVASDPFASMNAMAAGPAAAAVGPEIIVVKADEDVEQVGKQGGAARYGKVAAMFLAPLVAGLLIGQTGSSASLYNQTLEDAGKIAADVKKVRKSLVSLRNALLEAKSEKGYKVLDPDLLAALEGITIESPNFEVAYSSNMYNLDEGVVGSVFEFYTDSVRLKKELKEHLSQTKTDMDLLRGGTEKLEAVTTGLGETGLSVPYRFAVYPVIPTQKEAAQGVGMGARLVELGKPVCQDGKPSSSGTCQGPPLGFQARTNMSGKWASMHIATPKGDENDMIKQKQLLMLQPSDVFKSLVQGVDSTLAERDYLQRVKTLEANCEFLVGLGTQIEQKLNAKAGESRRFTFFL